MVSLKEATNKLKSNEYLLLVDKKKYRIFIYNKIGLVEKKGYLCGLGMKGYPTPKGLFRINIWYHKQKHLSRHNVRALKDHILKDSFDKSYYNHFYFGLDWKGDKKREVGFYPNRDIPEKLEYASLAIHGISNEKDILKKKKVSHGCIWIKKKDIDEIISKRYISKNKDTWILIK